MQKSYIKASVNLKECTAKLQIHTFSQNYPFIVWCQEVYKPA